MTISSTNNRGCRVIIEGPDCVGKDTFIAGLQDFINGVDRFGKVNLRAVKERFVVDKATNERLPETDPQTKSIYRWLKIHEMHLAQLAELEEFEVDPEHQAHYTEEEIATAARINDSFQVQYETRYVPLYADSISHRSIHSKDGSPESAEFLRKLDGGEITDQREIAEEYLQVHYDLENLAASLEEVLTVVIMNRSLISYHAMQIQTLAFIDLFDKWKKLWDYADQDSALFVRLTAPEAVVKERLAARQGADFRGDVENFFMDRWKQIEAGFVEFQTSGMCRDTITVDTTESPIPAYQQIIHWIVAKQINESIARGEGMQSFPTHSL